MSQIRPYHGNVFVRQPDDPGWFDDVESSLESVTHVHKEGKYEFTFCTLRIEDESADGRHIVSDTHYNLALCR